MSKVQRGWNVGGSGLMECSSGGKVIFSFDLTKVFEGYESYSVTQKSCIYYGIKQILSDYHNKDGDSTIATLDAMSKLLEEGKVDKTRRVKKVAMVDAADIVKAYESIDDAEIKAMFKKTLEEQGIIV